MTKTAHDVAEVTEYIASFPEEVRERLLAIRATILEAVPEAGETISYQIAAFTLGGRYMVYLAGYDKHIGMYPVPTQDPAIRADVAPYASGKSTVRFPHNKPIPFDLILRIVAILEAETRARSAKKERK